MYCVKVKLSRSIFNQAGNKNYQCLTLNIKVACYHPTLEIYTQSHLEYILTSPLERNRPTNTGTQNVLTYLTKIYITKNKPSVMLS